MSLETIALHVPRILLPRPGTDLEKWAVVACDQFTSQPGYWNRVEEFTGSSPSTFRLIFPEAYLEDPAYRDLTSKIWQDMERYLEEGILAPAREGFILVERTTSRGKKRNGLMVCLDLERYDFRKGSTSLIRATEGTVVERLPVRVGIRSGAAIESPHIMVLIDDPARTVIEPMFGRRLTKLYDFDLMMGGGHVRGYLVDDKNAIMSIASSLYDLADPRSFCEQYQVRSRDVLTYAVGDGNHSLASAKLFWEQLKSQAEDKAAIMRHPARYALVELVNVHDRGLEFEPIHRVLFNVSMDELMKAMASFFEAQGMHFSNTACEDASTWTTSPQKKAGSHTVAFVAGEQRGYVTIGNPRWNVEVGSVQAFLDAFCQEHPEVKIDYIHGDEVVLELAAKPRTVGLLLPVFPKNDLFKTIILEGVLPRKAFSMGHADEKRYYLECRKIRP
ncbi:MAG: DUF1015 domain-containing protein [Syntrophaceae bacterium]